MNQKKVYLPRIGAPFKENDAQTIGEFVYKLKGSSTAEILSNIKKNKSHTIANYIEWDDKLASEQFRLQQVRNIVNHIEIKIETLGDGRPIRMFHSIKIPEQQKRVYMDYETMASQEFALEQVISRAKVELDNWVERYQQYSQLSNYVRHLKLAFEEDKALVKKAVVSSS